MSSQARTLRRRIHARNGPAGRPEPCKDALSVGFGRQEWDLPTGGDVTPLESREALRAAQGQASQAVPESQRMVLKTLCKANSCRDRRDPDAA